MKTATRSCLLFALPLIAVLGLLPSAEKAQARTPDTFAAIAFSTSTGRWGYGDNYSTLAGAEARALVECGEPDAYIVAWDRNGWVALAVGNDPTAAGFAYASTQTEANLLALRECSTETTGAHLVVSVYSAA